MMLQFSANRSVGSHLIRWFTWSPYSHVDVVLPDGRLLGATPSGVKIRLPGRNTTRKIRFEVQDADWERVYQLLKSQVGKKYDWWALVGIVLRSGRWQKQKRWFCSELISWALATAGTPLLRIHHLHRITPRDLLMSPLLKRVN